MGTGASAVEAVQANSVDDVRTALEKLPEADRAKIQDALAQASKDAAPAEVADADKKEERRSAAPFLAEYFSKVQARTSMLVQNEEQLIEIAMDPEAATKFKAECKEWYEKEAKPLLTKSFGHHDTRKNDVLDKEEAGAFFGHLVAEETELSKAMAALQIQMEMGRSFAMMEVLVEPGQREDLKASIEQQTKTAIAQIKKLVEEKEDRYKADKAKHDVAAFKVLDTNGDGTLQLVEFLAAFEPESSRNIELHLALGFLTQEEVDEQKKVEEAAKELANELQECNVQ